MKTLYNDQVWVRTNPNGTFDVGFQKSMIDTSLKECFHVIPTVKKLKVDQIMCVIETHDGMQQIKSPVKGHVISFNNKARDFPDRLTDEDVVITMSPEAPTIPLKKKTVYVGDAVHFAPAIQAAPQQPGGVMWDAAAMQWGNGQLPAGLAHQQVVAQDLAAMDAQLAAQVANDAWRADLERRMREAAQRVRNGG